MKLYHKDVYFPNVDLTKFWEQIHSLIITRHFEMRRRLKNIPIVPISQLSRGDVFEIGMVGKKVIKVCTRVRSQKRDYCFVIGSGGHIITAWCQEKSDHHKSLKKERYCNK